MLPVYVQRAQYTGQLGNKMAKVLQRTEITLRSFYIFNSSLCKKEGEEHKKVLFYHPKDIELNIKIKDVGLSQAIITFTGTFSSEDDCKALHTQKTTQLFYQPEPGFWLAMVLNVPKEIKLKEGVTDEVTDYRGGEISDRIYQAVLRQCYHMYRFRHGPLQAKLTAESDLAAAEEQRLLLTVELQNFYEDYLINFKQLAQCDIMDMLHSIQYLALEKTLFLRAHNFSMMYNTFPTIKECIMLYNDQVVCGGKLSASDLYSLHAHIQSITNSEIGATVDDAYQSGDFVRNCGTNTDGGVLRVFLDLNSQIEQYYLIVYRALNFTLCLFVDAKQDVPKPEFYEELHAYMAPQLTSLARDIATELSKSSTASQDNIQSNGSPKYLFINEQSLRHHTNIQRHGKSIPRNVINIIADLSNPLHDDNNDANATSNEEVQVKTTNDFWVVKRRCNWRQYYVILRNSKASLLEVNQDAKRIFEQELKDDVFFDK